jgi:PAS domain S-box-containing protein
MRKPAEGKGSARGHRLSALRKPPVKAQRYGAQQHKRTADEEALRESEARFRELADNISQFAWTADRTGWIYWYNKRWHDYTGTTLEEMQGWGWQKVHHPEHVDRVVERIRQSFETGMPWEDTFPLRGRDGNYRWFLSRAMPIRNDGEVIRWFGTNTDITEQIEAEQALRESEARFRELADNISQLPTGPAGFTGTTNAGTTIPEPHSKKCKAGDGRKCIIPNTSIVSSSASGKVLKPACRGKTHFPCAVGTAIIAGSCRALCPSETTARSFGGLELTPTSPSRSKPRRRCTTSTIT